MALTRSEKIINTAFIGAVFAVALDRWLKVYALQIWSKTPHIFSDWFGLVLSKNYHISFSLNPLIDPIYFIIPITLVIAALFFQRLQKKRSWEASALLFIFLGSASNLYDRLAYGYVVDYFNLSFFTVFNLADVMISVGVICLLLQTFNYTYKTKDDQ